MGQSAGAVLWTTLQRREKKKGKLFIHILNLYLFTEINEGCQWYQFQMAQKLVFFTKQPSDFPSDSITH